MEIQEQRIHKLNEIIQICKDSEYGFRLAAKEVHKKDQKDLLLSTSRLRKEYAARLQAEVSNLGAKPAMRGTLAGLLHRAWMNTLYQMSLHRDTVVLRECERGEESALNVFEDVFESKLLEDMEQMLQGQFVNVIEMRDRLSAILHPTEKKGPEGSLLHL